MKKERQYGLSIIIPFYNSAETFKKLLLDLDEQVKDYPETEIIVINDGSKEYIDDIIKEYPKLIYFKQENKGVSAARNKGLELSSRKYIAFIDSDDSIENNYLKCIYEYLKDNYDYLVLKWKTNNKENTFLPFVSWQSFNHAVWGYVYNFKIIDNIKFNEKLNVKEDYDFLERIFKSSMSYKVIIPQIYSYNLLNEESLSHRFNRKEILEYKD